MTDDDVTEEQSLWELHGLISSSSDGTFEEHEEFLLEEDLATDDIPSSLLSYFESSKSRATACEKLFLEDLEDFTASHEDMVDFHIEVDKNKANLNEQDTGETENENDASSGGCLLPERETPVPDTVTLTLNNKVVEISENQQGKEELKKEEQIRQRELDFQEELKKLLEAEKLNQRELRLMEKRAQEKLEQELLLQQELISNLQKKVEEERRLMEEELRRMREEEEKKIKEEEKLKREEEDRKKRERENIKQEMQRQMMEEEIRSIKEENRKSQEMKTEEERKTKEEQMKKKEQEEKRKIAERKNMMEEKRKQEDKEDRKKTDDEKSKRRIQRIENEIIIKNEEEENGNIKEITADGKRRKNEEQMKEKESKREGEKNKIEEEKRKREQEEDDEKIREDENIETQKQRQKMDDEITRKNEVEVEMYKAELRKTREEEENRRKEEEKNQSKEEKKKKGCKADESNYEIWLKKEAEETREEEQINENDNKIKEKRTKNKRQEETENREEETNVIKVTVIKIKRGIKEINDKEIKVIEECRNKDGKTEVKEDEKRQAEVVEEKMRDGEKRENEQRIERIQLSEDKDNLKKDVKQTLRIENRDIRKVEGKIIEEEIKTQEEEEKSQNRKMEEEIIVKEESNKRNETENRKVEHKLKTNKREWSHEREEKKMGKNAMRNGDSGATVICEEVKVEPEVTENIKTGDTWPKNQEESKLLVEQESEQEERMKRPNYPQEKFQKTNSRKRTGGSEHALTSQQQNGSTRTFSSHTESTNPNTAPHHGLEENGGLTLADLDQTDADALVSSSPTLMLLCLHEHTEQKRLSWMKDCMSWSKLSLQNRRKQKEPLRGGRLPRRAAEASGQPPLCPDTLLQSTGCSSFVEVTTVTLGDLPSCDLSTLAQCTQLQSLTLRRCGLKSLEGISQLSQLCYIDVAENDISYVDCENMSSLRVLRLAYNKLTSIHGLSGASNLDVLELSHNDITRIAGLESMRRLQRLTVDHNQLISTKGLRNVYTLLHLNCSHNHLAKVEGLENCALLNTLDLRANSLFEPPSLDNHVLLRELRLDDNSISSLQALTACWLPLMQQLTVAQNRITNLPSMLEFVSLASLDLRFNCMSDLHHACKSLEGCLFLQDIYLSGNPLQQENGWRSTLQRRLPGLRAIDDLESDSFLSPPAVQQMNLASVSFLTLCQAQLQQIKDLQQQHSRELSKASSFLDSLKISFRHFSETLQLAENQRFAHEYGDITPPEGQTVLEETADVESTEKCVGHSQMEANKKVTAVTANRTSMGCGHWTLDMLPPESWLQTSDTPTTIQEADLNSLETNGTKSSSEINSAAPSDHQDMDLKNSAAIVIQKQWRKNRQKSQNVSKQAGAERRREAEEHGGPSSDNLRGVKPCYAATVIQAFWRGFSVRRRVACALAAITYPSTREDDTFEGVNMDEFVFDEPDLEEPWTLQLPRDSLSGQDPVSEQPLKFPGHLSEPSYYTNPSQDIWRPKEAWVTGERVDLAESLHGKSAASTPVFSGISERSEKILEEWGFTDTATALQMLKRAQNMKWKQQQKKKHRGSVSRAELGLQQTENPEQVRQDPAQRSLSPLSDRSSESQHFLPEMSSDILNGGRVQLVADPAYTERRRASGLWASSSKLKQYPHRIPSGQARKDVPSPAPVKSAPSKKDRISFRDNPVQLSGGWGGGKKHRKVHK